MDVYQPERRRKSRARERYAARQQNRMAVPLRELPDEERPITTRAPYEPGVLPALLGRAHILLRDGIWHLRNNRLLLMGLITAITAVVVIFLASNVLSGRIFPNVWALGVNVGSMTVDEAAAALQAAWVNDVVIRLTDEGRSWEARPAQMGIVFDARATAENARAAGLMGIPFGYGLLPVVSLDELRSQNYFLDLTEQSKIMPYNAGYRWEGDRLVGVPGSDGRFLDIAMTMTTLQENLPAIVDSQQFELIMTFMPPDVRDPMPHLEQARAFASRQFTMYGYDPFTDEMVSWNTDRDTITSWLEAGSNGLTVRRDVFANFVDATSRSLQQTDELRYIEPIDTIEKMQEAIDEGLNEVMLRIRYRSETYTVVRGDSGYRIAEKNGIPFYQLQQVNPGRDWDVGLVVGETMNLPSRDITVPLDPIPNKRIVVNLETQYLVAYENGEVVFNWAISSGMSTAPTSPGIYQILNHDPVASGGSYTLCGSMGCAQWKMYWFMGIYEVIPGLVNGFHGAVLLPNGTYLAGGSVGRPYTYGCIMSENNMAELLYNWAEDGTIVEIVDRTYQPRSELARQMVTEGWGV